MSKELISSVGEREKFTNQFVEDLRRLAQMDKFNDPIVNVSWKDESIELSI